MKVISIIMIASIILCSLAFSDLFLCAKANYTYLLPPQISIKSPQAIYNTSSLQLKFNITYSFDNSEISRNALYSLDGEGNITIPLKVVYSGGSRSIVDGQIQLTNLSDGYHKIEVFAVYRNTRSNYVFENKETLNFLINTNFNFIGSSPSPTVPEFPSVLTIVFLITATLVFSLAIRKKYTNYI
jgi:hypothetical protein